MTTKHDGHDTWPLISDIGTIWCRTCQVHFHPGERRTVEDVLRPLLDTRRMSERDEAPRCPHCDGKGCARCQYTGYPGGREP